MNFKNKCEINILTIGRFHVFEYARMFEEIGILNKIISGYPKFKLKDEPKIPGNKIIGIGTHGLYMYLIRFKYLPELFLKTIDLLSIFFFQAFSSIIIFFNKAEYLLILSKSGLLAALIQKYILHGKVIVEHTSTHPKNYNKIVEYESKFYNIKPQLIDNLSLLIHELEFKIADKIIVPTNYVKHTFKNYSKKLVVIPIPSNDRFRNFLEISNFKKKEKVSKLSNKPNIKILSICQVTPRKGIRYLLETLNYLSNKFEINLTLIGKSSFAMNNYIKNYPKNFEINYIENLSQKKLIKNYFDSDIFLLLSAEEGLPSVFKESILCSLPIIGSIESGSKDLEIENKVFCVDKTDKININRIIQKIISNQELNSHFGKNFIEKFDNDILNKWENIIKNLSK